MTPHRIHVAHRAPVLAALAATALLALTPAGRAGTWTKLVHNPPAAVNLMLLLPDGTVMASRQSGPIGKALALVAFVTQVQAHEVANVLFVLDHQDAWLPLFFHSWCIRASHPSRQIRAEKGHTR